MPVGFGVLTVDTIEQARARVKGGSKRDTGRHAVEAALASLAVKRELAERPRRAGFAVSERSHRAASGPPIRRVRILDRRMSKVCHVCAKGPSFGHSRSHSMVATNRRFDPNLQRVRIDDGGTPRRVYVCTRCLKAGKVTKAR